MKKNLKTLTALLLATIVLILVGVFGVNFYVLKSTEDQILDIDDSTKASYDAILILGAGIVGDKPSPMLKERLDRGIELYNKGIAPIIIMSGDHTRSDHDEVNVMKRYASIAGVPSDDIFMDHAGISTYDSIYRLKEVFSIKKVAIVTQGYHLYRAIYIANALGLDSVGFDAKKKTYSGQFKREIREVLARDKDVVKCLFKPTSFYNSETIPVSGGGNSTNDQPYLLIKDRDKDIEYFITDAKTISQIEYLFSKEWTDTCQKAPQKVLELEFDHRKYSLEIFDDTLHIKDGSKEIVLNAIEGSSLQNIIEN